MSIKEPKTNERDTARKLRQELCALQEELRLSRELLKRTAEIAARGELHRHAAEAAVATTRRLLQEVWEAGTDDTLPFYQRLPALQRLGRRVGEELAALEGREGAECKVQSAGREEEELCPPTLHPAPSTLHPPSPAPERSDP